MGGSPTICELGPLGVRFDGGWTAVRGRRSAAVLALLAVDRNRARTIDELVEVGWAGPERPATARQSLANVLSRLRRTYGSTFVESIGHGYRLGDGVVSERQRLLRLLEDGAQQVGDSPAEALRLTELALDLWRGTPWGDLDDIDELRIDRSRLVQAHYRLRSLRAEALTMLGRPHDAIAIYTELVDDDPTNEAAWNGWAGSLGATQRRVEALRVIDRARATLAESGLLVGSELLDTERRLLDDSAADEAEPRPGIPPASHDLPLSLMTRPRHVIGRDRELTKLLGAWRNSQMAGGVQVVVGAAGVGKTTLVTEFAHRVAEQGGNVLHGAADDVLNMPFQPFVLAATDWLERADGLDLAEGDRHVLASVLGLGDTAGSQAPFQVVDAFHRALSRVADSGPAVLVLEDLHWATPETLLLTRSLARRVPRGVLIVATTRPTPTESNGVLDALLADMRRVPSMSQITLGELDADDVAELVTKLVPHRGFDPSTVAELVGGNPLLIAEFAAASADALQHDPGWTLAETQLLASSAAQRLVLELAAVLGESFWAEDLAAAAERTLDETLEFLDDAEARRLVAMTEARTWQFRHALVRDVVLDQLTPRTRAELHFRVANALARQRRPRTAEIAQHYAAAVGYGGRESAVTWLRRAAGDASSAGAHEQAAQHWSQVIELDREADARALMEAHMARGDALVRAGYWERSHESFEAAANLAEECGDHETRADAVIAWVQAPENHTAQSTLPDFVLATRSLLDELDDSRSARLAGIFAIDASDHNRLDEARDLLRRARMLVAGVDDVEAQAFVERARFRTWWDPGQIEARYQAALDLAALGRVHESPNIIGYALRWQIIHGVESGRLTTVMFLCRQLIKHGRQTGEPFHVWLGWSRLAVVNLALGNVGDSLECLDHATDLAEILDTDYVRASHGGVQLGVELQLGHDAVEKTHRAEVAGLGVLQALAAGALDEVRAHLDALDPVRVAEFGQLLGEMPGRLFWGPLSIAAAATDAVDHAEALLPLMDDSRDDFSAHIPGASFLGAHGLHLGILHRTVGDLDLAIAEFERSIDRNDEVGAKVPSAICRWLLADALVLRNGSADEDRALEIRESARSIAPEFDVAASPLVRALT